MNVFERAKQTLIIIDMQVEFMACGRGDEYEIIPAIVTLIRYAKENKWPVIVVEYIGYERTDDLILEALCGYPHQETVFKDENDGGLEVMNCLDEHPAWPLNLLVCGICGNECVAETVSGLFEASSLIEVDVITDAIIPDYSSRTTPNENGNLPEKRVVVKDVVDEVVYSGSDTRV